MSELKGKVVAITGASSGIGEATARLLAERGAHVVLGARREDRLAKLAADVGGAHLRTDVTRREDLHALVALACNRFGRLDVLVSNAGVGPVSLLDELQVDDWDEMVDVNIKGLLHGIAAALPVFRRQGSGHFVTTVSTAAFRIVPTMAVYAGTKFAQRAICEGLRQEAGDAVRVTAVSPGPIATDFGPLSSDHPISAQFARIKEIAIAPDAVARAIAFAIEQPADVEMNEIVVRPTAQS